jgi:homoserine O-succinyltransferase
LNKSIKVAIIDLYDNETNQGMRCIQDIVGESNEYIDGVDVDFKVYDSRYKGELPSIDYDIYISSGGPGSPFDGEGKKWEKDYFNLMDDIWSNNQNSSKSKKHVFFICHSFQIMARYFQLGEVIERKSKSFGLLPVHKTETGIHDPILDGLKNPFYGADFRGWQVVQPNNKRMAELEAKIICLEKIRPHVDLERAMMAIRVSDEIVGTQFHPEADPASMEYHFKQPERKKMVFEEYGEEKWKQMIKILEEQNNVWATRNTVIPNFLKEAYKSLRPELTPA